MKRACFLLNVKADRLEEYKEHHEPKPRGRMVIHV